MKNAEPNALPRLRLLLLTLALPLAGCIDAGDPADDDAPVDPPALEDPTPLGPTGEAAPLGPIEACHDLPEGARLCWQGRPVELPAAATLAVAGPLSGEPRALIADADRRLHWLAVADDGEIVHAPIAGLTLPAPATAGVIGDGDGDGTLEIALHTGDRGYWLAPLGGAWDGVSFMPPAPVLGVLAADVDGDGRPNPIFAHAGPDGVAGLSAFVDNEAASASTSERPATGVIAAGDVDGDGLAEVLVATADSTVAVFKLALTNAALVAADEVTALPEGEIAGLLVADLDGDGVDDLIAHQRPDTCDADACDDVLSVLRGSTGGLSPERQGLRIGRGAGRPIVADLDGDGALDLAAAHAGDVTITVLLGDGLGSFRDRFDLTAAPVVGARLAAGDLDGDGRDDLLLAGGGSPGLWVLLSHG